MSGDWAKVDSYIEGRLMPPDPALEAALAGNREAGLPSIDVSPTQGKFLHILARAMGARRILEIGALGGYSTIWLARALPPEGRLVTLEADAHHAATATANIARAGLAERVTVKIGRALDTLPTLAAEGGGPFDLVFIDADKPNNPAYLAWALKLTRPGSLIVCDNVIRDGAVADPKAQDGGARGARALFDAVAAEPRLSATAMQTVGAKGWDGFVLAYVNAA